MSLPLLLGHDRWALLVTQYKSHGGVHVFIAEKFGEPLDSAFRRPATSVVVVALDLQAGEAHRFSERQQGFIHTHTRYSQLTRLNVRKNGPFRRSRRLETRLNVRYPFFMSVETIGDAYAASWRVKVRCTWGPRDGMKQVRECVYGAELDLQTLVWTRGGEFPLTMLESRLKCPRCGSRRVRVAFTVPPSVQRARA